MLASPFHLSTADTWRRQLSRARAGAASLVARLLVLTGSVVFAFGVGAPATASAAAPPDTMLPLRITDVVVEDGQLIAIGSLGDTTFRSPLELTARPLQEGQTCPILDLELGPIHLDLLGLVVDTSPICLTIDAESGEGNLLGNLLCDVAGLLDDGLPLGAILAALDPGELADLLEGIEGLLNGALEAATDPTTPGLTMAVSDSGNPRGQGQGNGKGNGKGNPPGRVCDILNLSIGPVELNLLGLVVVLDDCDGGPVTIDITAERGRGNLLGNLLCGLAGLLDDPVADLDRIARQLTRIADAIERLI